MIAVAEHADDTQLDAIAAQARGRPGLSEERLDELLRLAGRESRGAARQQLVEHHLDVALAAALQRRGIGVDLGDLYQEAAIAVVVAIEEYSTRGDAPARALRAHVEQVVRRHLDGAAQLEEDRRQQEEAFVADARLLSAAEVALRRQLQRQVVPAEIAEVLQWPVERVELLHSMLETAGAIDDASLLDYLDDTD